MYESEGVFSFTVGHRIFNCKRHSGFTEARVESGAVFIRARSSLMLETI